MDPIKNQIAAIDPFDPATEPNGEEALHRMLSGSTVYSDTNPLRSVPSLEDRRRRKARITAGLLLGAAAVTGGVVIASNFGPVSSVPAPAVTVSTPTPTVSVTAAPTPTPSATPSASTTPEPTRVPTPTASAVATTAPAVPPVQVPTTKTFTFPDGHLSFEYPADWTIKTEQGPYLSEETKAASVGATVFDASGARLAFINSGMYGDGTAGVVDRTILDRAVVPGVTPISGEQVVFGFSSNQSQYIPYDGPAYEGMPSPRTGPVEGPPTYVMDVRVSSMLESGITTSGTNQIRMPNGMMNAYVYFDYEKQPTFATPAAAKAWMGTQQYVQLKALLLSLSYK